MTQVTAALMSFRMVALLPHHLPRLIGFTAANRVDHEAFYNQAGWAPGEQVASGAQRAHHGREHGSSRQSEAVAPEGQRIYFWPIRQ